MNILEYLAEPQTAVVFDIDGVLAVYEFGELCHAAELDGSWEDYVLNCAPYASVPAVPQIQAFISQKDPSMVFACSVADDYEEAGKRDFVTSNYAIPAENVVFVRSKDEKLDFLKGLADRLGIPQRRVALVEDTVKTLDQVALNSEVATVHVSSFFAYGL